MDKNKIGGFDWGAGNMRKSDDKHGISQAAAESIFFNQPLVVADDVAHSQSEARYHALGRADTGQRLHITFTIRGNGRLIRVISARPMSRKERRIYEQQD
jgi:uncharacterized DUF497 family protein